MWVCVCACAQTIQSIFYRKISFSCKTWLRFSFVQNLMLPSSSMKCVYGLLLDCRIKYVYACMRFIKGTHAENSLYYKIYYSLSFSHWIEAWHTSKFALLCLCRNALALLCWPLFQSKLPQWHGCHRQMHTTYINKWYEWVSFSLRVCVCECI